LRGLTTGTYATESVWSCRSGKRRVADFNVRLACFPCVQAKTRSLRGSERSWGCPNSGQCDPRKLHLGFRCPCESDPEAVFRRRWCGPSLRASQPTAFRTRAKLQVIDPGRRYTLQFEPRAEKQPGGSARDTARTDRLPSFHGITSSGKASAFATRRSRQVGLLLLCDNTISCIHMDSST
jgi:hypothetical protein